MKALRILGAVLFLAATLVACEADSGSSGTSPAVPGDAVAQGDTSGDAVAQGDTSGDTASTPVNLDAASSDVQTTEDVAMEDAGSGPTETEADVEESSDGGEQVAEDVPEADLVVGEGACTNDSDLAVLADFDIAAEQMTIGMACYDAAGGPGQTSTDEVMACFVETLSTEYGFSLDCSQCVTDQLMCLQEFCMEGCMSSMMSGVTSPECEACLEENGCKSDFVECSGLNPNIFTP
jgi:hypothetical protein